MKFSNKQPLCFGCRIEPISYWWTVLLRFGDIKSIKLTTEPNCYAFVNYVESEPAGQAMEALQGSHWLLSTMQPLLVRFPHNVVNTLIPTLWVKIHLSCPNSSCTLSYKCRIYSVHFHLAWNINLYIRVA